MIRVLTHSQYLASVPSLRLRVKSIAATAAAVLASRQTGSQILVLGDGSRLLPAVAVELAELLRKSAIVMHVDVAAADADTKLVRRFAGSCSAIVDARGFAEGDAGEPSAALSAIVRVAQARRSVPAPAPLAVSLRTGAALKAAAAVGDDGEEVGSQDGSALSLYAIDAPSAFGAHTDATLALGGAVHAALLTFPAAGALGELLAVPDSEGESAGVALLPTHALVRALLPPRPLNGHKGTFGTLLICAGSNDYWGAPLLSARGALRAGAGIVALAVPPALRVAAATALPEATMPALTHEHGERDGLVDGCLSGKAAHHLLGEAKRRRVRAVLVGPGMKEAEHFLRAYLAHDEAKRLPLVLDADALNALPSLARDWWTVLPRDTVLTPHPGEMERLCSDAPAPTVIATMTCEERMALAAACAQKWRAVVLLKGAFTVIAAPDGAVRVLPFASPALAIGGSGDVLAGVIAALRCQGASAFDAAVGGAHLHGTAGQLMEAMHGASGVLAHELAERIPAARLATLNS